MILHPPSLSPVPGKHHSAFCQCEFDYSRYLHKSYNNKYVLSSGACGWLAVADNGHSAEATLLHVSQPPPGASRTVEHVQLMVMLEEWEKQQQQKKVTELKRQVLTTRQCKAINTSTQHLLWLKGPAGPILKHILFYFKALNYKKHTMPAFVRKIFCHQFYIVLFKHSTES